MDFEAIVKHYIEVILPNDLYFNSNPVNDKGLLYPPFLTLLDSLEHKCIMSDDFIVFKDNKDGYCKGENVFDFVETYRSNTLQKEYYDSGASKISANGMHHYGIAADLIFLDITGKRTYKGNFNKLHELYEGLGGPDLGTLEVWDAGHLQHIPVSLQSTLRDEVRHALILFQQLHGLTPDGIPGPVTHSKAKEVFKV